MLVLLVGGTFTYVIEMGSGITCTPDDGSIEPKHVVVQLKC
jgi:hypothetical protein